MKRNSLGKKTEKVIILFALMIIVTVGAAVCYGILAMKMRDFNEETFDYARLAAEVINGDTIEKYVDTGEKDHYYQTIDDDLQIFMDELDLNECLVVVPDGDEFVTIWNVSRQDDEFDLGQRIDLGDLEESFGEAFTRQPSEKPIKMHDDEGINIIALAPVLDSVGEPVAVVAVDRTDPTIRAVLAQFLRLTIIISVIISAIMMILAYVIMRRNIIRPIGILTESADKIVGNLERDETVEIELNTNDELQTLAEALMKMDIDLKQYIEKLSAITAEKERIEAELDLAARIQLGMLPKLEPPFVDNDRFELYASAYTAKEVGGDFYDFFMVDDKHIALLIADVSGKGIPAALFMVVAKILIKNDVQKGMSPAEALRSVNETLMESNNNGFFVTVWLAIIDLETGKGVATNAGHEHPFLKRKDGSFEIIKYKHSLPVAAMEETTFEEHEFALEPGDTIFVNTDGVTEAIDVDNNEFGTDGLLKALNENPDAPLKDILNTANDALNAFAGEAPQFDDETMLAFRYKG